MTTLQTNLIKYTPYRVDNKKNVQIIMTAIMDKTFYKSVRHKIYLCTHILLQCEKKYILLIQTYASDIESKTKQKICIHVTGLVIQVMGRIISRHEIHIS